MSIAGLVLCVALSAFIVLAYLRRIGGQSRVTALLSAMPGGAVEMVMIGRAKGGDEGAIILRTCLAHYPGHRRHRFLVQADTRLAGAGWNGPGKNCDNTAPQ